VHDVCGLVVIDVGRVGDGRGGTAAPAARDLVVVDAGGDGRGTTAPADRGLVVVDVGRVGNSRGRGGTAAPAACDLTVVDAGVVRLLLEGLGLTSALDGCDCLRAVNGCLSAPRLLARGSVRGVLPWSTAQDPVRGLVVIDVGRVGDGRGRGGTAAPAARDLVVVDDGCVGDDRGTMAPAVLGLVVVDVGRIGDGRGRGGTAAPAACDLVVVDAGVVGLLLEGLGLTTALDGRDCLLLRK